MYYNEINIDFLRKLVLLKCSPSTHCLEVSNLRNIADIRTKQPNKYTPLISAPSEALPPPQIRKRITKAMTHNWLS